MLVVAVDGKTEWREGGGTYTYDDLQLVSFHNLGRVLTAIHSRGPVGKAVGPSGLGSAWRKARPMEGMRVATQPRRGTSLIRLQIALAGQSVGMSPSASPNRTQPVVAPWAWRLLMGCGDQLVRRHRQGVC